MHEISDNEEGGEDEIEEIEDSDVHISESRDMKDGKEMEMISRQMARQFKASKNRKSVERDAAGAENKYSNRWMLPTEVKVQFAQRAGPLSANKLGIDKKQDYLKESKTAKAMSSRS